MRNYVGGIRVAICDDHAVVRSALRDLLESEPDLVVVGETTNADEAVNEVRQSRPDVLLLDISMRGRSGLDALPELREASPGTGIVIVSVETAPSLRQAAFAAGARGYVAKDAPGELISAVRQAARPADEQVSAPGGVAVERRAARDRRTGVDRRLLQSTRTPGMERRLGDRRSAVDRRRQASPAAVH